MASFAKMNVLRPPALGPAIRCIVARPFRLDVRVAAERLRLGNLHPAPGSRRDKTRKGRGHAAGQGATCGFGNRGQKSRKGPGVRPGFEGGQTPLYRRLPKLRGIAGGMGAGLPDFVTVNVADLEKHFQPNEEVTLEKVKAKVLNVSGRKAKLPLKVLGNGELNKALVVKARDFSESAKAKIEAVGGKCEEVPGPKHWTKKGFKTMVKQMAENGLDYYAERVKAKVERLQAKGLVNRKRPVSKSAKVITAAQQGSE